METENDRRLKIALVNTSLLLDFLTTSNVTGVRYAKIASEPLVPDGSKVVHVSYDMSRMCLAVVLCHESFDVVPPGCIIPVVADWELEYTIVKVNGAVVEIVDDDRELIGKCEGCSVPLFDSDYGIDSDGNRFCKGCFDSLVAAGAEDFPDE